MYLKAYGKINLSINVIGKRSDGYHLLDMIMLPLADLYDEIDIELAEENSYESNDDLPFNETNLIFKAIELMKAEFNLDVCFKVKVKKNIPICSGLAGGSSDAAATLKIINTICHLGLSNSQLAMYGKRLGADVPFCIFQVPARVQGIGELIRPLRLNSNYEVLLVKPKQGVPTKLCFELTDNDEVVHPDMDKLEKEFIAKRYYTDFLGNSLQKAAITILPEIGEILAEMKSLGYENSLMSGSGSTCFVIDYAGTDFEELKNHFKQKYDFVVQSRVLVE